MDSLNKYYSKENLSFLAHILNSAWGSQFEATGEIMKERINSGSLFVFSYGLPTEEEKELYECVCKTNLLPEREIPLGLLETIALRTDGDYSHIKNYNELTNKGRWRKPEQDADTLILVDITVLETRRGKKGKGEAKTIVNFALDKLARNNVFRFIWTYTPNIKKIQKWHESLGADNTNHIIANARPNFIEPDVCLMSYTRKLEVLRRK